jgi:HAD superfamily hydrolase (TIGR01509 family)
VIIFDCNGVLVDSEPIAAAVASEHFTQAGIPISAQTILTHFFGRRPADMVGAVEAHAKRKLPANFIPTLAAATLERFRADLRAMPHAAHALTWLRGPKCVASSSPMDRIETSLEMTDLFRFFDDNLFSANEVKRGKPAPDLFLHVARQKRVKPSACLVVEDSPAGVNAAAAAGMTAIGFVGSAFAPPDFGRKLTAAGAKMIVADLRQLKSAVLALRGW